MSQKGNVISAHFSYRGWICKHDGVLPGVCLLQYYHCLVSLLPFLVDGQGRTLEVLW